MTDVTRSPTDLPDADVLTYYREFSEEFYAAGFHSAGEQAVKWFREWLVQKLAEQTQPIEDYEQVMLDEFHRQEAAVD